MRGMSGATGDGVGVGVGVADDEAADEGSVRIAAPP